MSLSWVPSLRAVLLALGAGFSAWLMVRLCWTARSARALGGLLLAWSPLALMLWVWIRALFGA